MPLYGLAAGLPDKRTNQFMRILLIHSDNIEYEALSKTKMAEVGVMPNRPIYTTKLMSKRARYY
ncbi:MAG TPA: hypothetical protein VJY43_04525 [Methanocorpusculum sp.]|nr:hypothetical protein [Methanocorpusculum sp.]